MSLGCPLQLNWCLRGCLRDRRADEVAGGRPGYALSTVPAQTTATAGLLSDQLAADPYRLISHRFQHNVVERRFAGRSKQSDRDDCLASCRGYSKDLGLAFPIARALVYGEKLGAQ
jgi:hypothetical protein